MTANEIRDSFKKFFESKQHAIVPSAPMVIKDDPTLMFTNAGMNQWKDIILGTRDPEPRRRADTQKCLRVSGKHNDLEEVGHDTYHHTMFEMLGNWSFGDYFKEGAIDMAWEYLVDVLKLNPEDLYVTVFEGSPEENIPRDDEAAKYWAKHVPEDHIINGINVVISSLKHNSPLESQYSRIDVFIISDSFTDKILQAEELARTILSELSQTTTPFAILKRTASNLFLSNVICSIFCSSYPWSFSDIILKASNSSLISPDD